MAAASYGGLFHSYESDEAALAAEDAIVASQVDALGVVQWTDPSISQNNLLYGDGETAIPDSISWNRISLGEVAGCSSPSLFGDTGARHTFAGHSPAAGWVLKG